MKGITIHIVILMFVRLFFGSGSLQAADSIACDSSLHIVFNCVPTLDGIELQRTDIITVETLDSETVYNGSVSYVPDSNNIIMLSGFDTQGILASDSITLSFHVSSASRTCNTSRIEYETGARNDSTCTLNIDKFEAYSYSLEYTDTSASICYDSLLSPVDYLLPDHNFTISSDAGLSLDGSNGIISIHSSLPGNYTVTVESEYCFTQDQVQISIIDVLPIDIFDTLTLCEGASISQEGVNLEEYTVFSRSDNVTSVEEITGIGEYILIAEQDGCSAIDSVYIDVLNGPEFTIDEQEECDRIILQLNVNSNSNTTAHWSNGVNGEVNEIFEDQMLFVEVIDDKGCIATDSLLAVVNIMEILSVEMQKQEADCWEEGHIDITDSEVINNIGEYRYRLQNKLTGEYQSSMQSIPEGVYSLQVLDDRDCVSTYKDDVTILQKCLEEYPVFTPNGDNIEDEYFIPHEGSVKIYNREGILLKELTTPAYWDGLSDTGNPLPMGNYFIVTDTGKVVNITIVK